MNIIDAIAEPRALRQCFGDLSTWRSWLTFLKVWDNIPIDDPADIQLFRDATGLTEQPNAEIRESVVICGRRSGKSFISAVIAVYQACFKDWTPYLNKGERGWIFIIANDRNQARIIKDYISGILDSTPTLRAMVERDLADQIDLKNRVSIKIATNSFRTIRGYTVLTAICEEVAFWRSDLGANPDREVVNNALKPAMVTIPGARLILISTAYARLGLLYDLDRKHWGQPGKTLVWKAPSLVMNPTLDADLIREALAEDPQAAAAEWNCEYRQDIESFLSFEALASCIVTGRFEIPPLQGVKYNAFIDPSFGGQDSFTLGIAHAELEGRFFVLDMVKEWKPGFKPEAVVAECAAIVKAYRCFRIVSDRFSREWVRDQFRFYGIETTFSQLSASEIYLDFLPVVTSRTVELPDNKRLTGQLANLERRVRTGGYDLVTHFPGQHDDLANAAAGAVVFAGRAGRGSVWEVL
jgi:hypothetical protein